MAVQSASVRVVCVDWVSHPMSAERASEWAERVRCGNDHEVVAASAFDQSGSRGRWWEDEEVS